MEFDIGDDCRICGQGQNPDGWVMKIVKIDAPTFNGWIDLQVFSDWLSNMGRYFKWPKMSEIRKVEFATMKLVSRIRLFWTNLENHEQLLGHH